MYEPNSRFTGPERATTAMMTAIRTHILKKGFYNSREEAVGSKGTIDSCLLHKIYKENSGPWPKICLPKIDGIRCRYKDGISYSRGGKEIKGLPKYDRDWDCELYIPGATLEEIQSVVTGSGDKSSVIPYVFDICIPDVPFKERIKMVHSATGITKVPYIVTRNQEEDDKVYHQHLKDGYEGTVYRDPEGLYECKRTSNTLKRKPEVEEEFKIDSWEYDDDGNILFILQCSAGKFRVVPSWPDKRRKDIGYAQSLVPIPLAKAYATVRYQTKTARGIPKFGNVITIRVTSTDGKIIY
jgi:hypothetical protein